MTEVERKRLHTSKLLRFFIGGVANTSFTYAIYFALNVFMSYHLAFLFAYSSGVALSYCINARFVFETGMSWRSGVVFPFIYLIIYLYSAVLLYVFVGLFGLGERLAPLLVVLVTFPINFCIIRAFLRRSMANVRATLN